MLSCVNLPVTLFLSKSKDDTDTFPTQSEWKNFDEYVHLIFTYPLHWRYNGHNGNSPVTGEFPAQRQVTRSFDVFFDQRLNKQLGKQSWGWWFETPSRSLWCHCNDITYPCLNPLETSHQLWSFSLRWPHETLLNNVSRLTTKKSSKLISPAPQLFVHRLIQYNKQETTEALHYLPFVLGFMLSVMLKVHVMTWSHRGWIIRGRIIPGLLMRMDYPEWTVLMSHIDLSYITWLSMIRNLI